MNYPKFIVSNQKEESISIQRVKMYFSPWKLFFKLADSTDPDEMPGCAVFWASKTNV